MGSRPREGEPTPPTPMLRFDMGTLDGYDFYLRMGSLANADEKYFQRKNPYWTEHINHTTYDEYWQSRAIWKYLKAIKPAVMLVGGWYDTEDPAGLFRQYHFMEKNTPPNDMLVAGTWEQGRLARGAGDPLGNWTVGSKTPRHFAQQI